MFTKPFKTNGFRRCLAPRWLPKWPKIAPRRLQDDLEEVFCFASIFVIDFGRFWVPFLAPSGRLLGAQIGHFWHRFLDDFRIAFQDRPESGQELLKSSPRAPKRPKRSPRAAQEQPQSAQERPKSDPKRPKSGQEGPKTGQERTNAAKMNNKKQSKVRSKSKQQSTKIQT